MMIVVVRLLLRVAIDGVLEIPVVRDATVGRSVDEQRADEYKDNRAAEEHRSSMEPSHTICATIFLSHTFHCHVTASGN